MSTLARFKFFLWYFGLFKVPMIGSLRPRLIELNHEMIVIKLRLSRKTKNHLQSMYFGALAVGADIAGGLHGFYHASESNTKISLAFKSFHAQFVRRPESDVYFVSNQGNDVKQMMVESKTAKKRVNQSIQVIAYTNYQNDHREEVATFQLELSLKVLN